jgi:hypothetical protein
MKCYICEKSTPVGGTCFGVADAVGVCHNCGVAVCIEHSFKAPQPGSPLLCPQCAERERSKKSDTTIQGLVEQTV